MVTREQVLECLKINYLGYLEENITINENTNVRDIGLGELDLRETLFEIENKFGFWIINEDEFLSKDLVKEQIDFIMIEIDTGNE